MIMALILLLFAYMHDEFASTTECIILLLLLGIVPVLAYPYQKVSPKYKAGGRSAQRKLAFVFTLLGYTAALLQPCTQ